MRIRTGWPWPWRRPGRRPLVTAPSRTSQVVALTRAGFSRPHTPDGDPQAQQRLCAGMQPVRPNSLGPHLAARTRFFDDQVLAAIGRGTSQVVILGAGYDDRALRFRAPGVRYFEIDHPATQADKRRRLEALTAPGAAAAGAGPVLAAADFRAGDVAAVLAGCGHDPEQDTLFLCEGLLVYLDAPVITALLRGLRERAAPGSVLAASLAVHADGVATATVVATATAADDPARGGAPGPAGLGGLGERGRAGRRGPGSRGAATAVAAGRGAAGPGRLIPLPWGRDQLQRPGCRACPRG
jgi:methyltransferase (TIGR00027 family)